MLLGIAAPVLAILLLADRDASQSLAAVFGPVLAIGLMGTGMIAAATSTRFWVGVGLALATGMGLIALARALGMPPLAAPLSTGLAIIAATISFAARGFLFSRSAADMGWLVALGVVAGEAAIVMTAFASPGVLPGWLLALLPAQWASDAIQMTLASTDPGGTDGLAAKSQLLALLGTAAATLLVVQLWPRRWTYAVMFTAWLGFSALVFHWPG